MTDAREDQDEDEDHIDIVVADSFTVDFCEHGYGQIGFWHEGEKRPFAIAYFKPESTPDLARLFADAMKVEGHA